MASLYVISRHESIIPRAAAGGIVADFPAPMSVIVDSIPMTMRNEQDRRASRRSGGIRRAGLILVWIWLIAGCGPGRIAPPPPRADPVKGLSTPRIAILPFKDRTGESGLAVLVRASIYSHLSARPFRDIELSVVDARMGADRLDSEDPDAIKALGRRIGADLIMTGEVLSFHRVFAGVFSQMTIDVGIKIWDVSTGRWIWNDRHQADITEGGLPFSPLEIPLISLRSGYHLRDRNKIRIVDDLSRYVVGRIPLTRSADPPERRYELQVHAFSDRLRAEDTLRQLRDIGHPAYLETVEVMEDQWHRVILGPYGALEEAEETRDRLPPELARKAFVRDITP